MFEGLFQPMHLGVIVGLALLMFGPKKLPELGKGIGEGIRSFKSAMNDRADAVDANPTADKQARCSSYGRLRNRISALLRLGIRSSRSKAHACHPATHRAHEARLR
jgi:sec-independent protein translocase protein TatA